MASNTPILQVEQASRRYGARWAVESASFALEQGRITCLLGPSGCGKSSLLRMISGLEPLDEGRIFIRGQMMSAVDHVTPPEHRGVGLVFQDNALFPHLDVRGNIAFGIRHLPKAEQQQRIDDLLARFHISHLSGSWPHMLSGGEQQRVAIARALARQPSLLLLDEPFSGLDTHLRATLRKSLLQDLRAAGATVLIVTHDPEEAMGMADELMLMAGGHILQHGTPQFCYDRPTSLAAARLLGDMLDFAVDVRGGAAETLWGRMPAPLLADGPAHLMLRPSMLYVSSDASGGGAAAQVQDMRYLGGEYGLRVLMDGQLLDLKALQPIEPDQPVMVRADLSHALLLPC
ncbi:ABC transporter ATP-binding protein [Sphingopyxis yananensis]|uniref:ABC transporter ATP-binding protein n=1 Tax=Sphingopyxis yananensis TaxID=2886687 RepID=UPI001D10F8C2|nr:ABC transporter ATP-binding protein [Sphingopyxis yananensis]MCC2601141.1 ABC transporter ATP-binding protein [Sphingopyxis yananensis]